MPILRRNEVLYPMIVLHAAVFEGQLILWGETPIDPTQSLLRNRTRKKKIIPVKNFPYDAGMEGVQNALAEAGIRFPMKRNSFSERIAWLPTANKTPVPSSSLIADPPEGEGKIAFAPWAITGLPLSSGEALEFLCACMGKQTLAPGIIIGKDLEFWTFAARLAGSLAAKQQFLPGLVKAHETYTAGWKPVFSGDDRQRLGDLAKAMPEVSRAVLPVEEDTALPQDGPLLPSALSVLTQFVEKMTDCLIRLSAAFFDSKRLHADPSFYPSLHDHWAEALRFPKGIMEGDEAELARLASQINDWQRSVTATAVAPFRLCFRLEEPAENGETRASFANGPDAWYVRYLLQDLHDPSLLLPASEAWQGGESTKSSKKKKNLSPLFRNGFQPREHLFLSLGQASGICPRIEGSLKTAAPAGYEIDAAGAIDFLTEKAQVLEQAGFGVMLPAWWSRKGTKLRLTVRANVKSPKMQGGGGLSLEEIVQVDWSVALGDTILTLAELRELARLKAPLVKFRGQWVQMKAEEIQEALNFWKKKAREEASVKQVIQLALGAVSAQGPIAFEGVTATGWIADFLKELEGKTPFQELAIPEGFQGTLRPYQVRGYSWIGFLRKWGLGACLADDMGLGKTIQTLALIRRDWQKKAKGPILLICPMSVVGNWQKEASRFTPDLPVMVHHGLDRTKGDEFQERAMSRALVISSYALLHRDYETIRQVPWSGVVLDEAQNIKNPETKQARAARAISADYRLALTGTPVENNVGDLWSIMEFLNPGFLGTQTEFKKKFFIPIQTGSDPEAMSRLKTLTQPFILRRLKTDRAIIADLPKKMEMKVFCTLTKEQASLYEAVVKEALRGLDKSEGIQRKGVILATLSKLKQVCNHPAQFLKDNSSIPDRSGKLARLTEMAEEVIAVGDRALVFSQFAEMGEILKRHLQEFFGKEVLFLHGGITKAKRDLMIEHFQAEEDGPSIFVLSLKAGGTGLNLTRASHVFHFDRWWNPAVENQATDRVFRIGQTKNVQVHKFICAGTLEEKIDEMIERKKKIAEKVIGTGEGWLTELSTAELKDLFALRKEAIGE
jgi:SNF2 family DNA or RNA helicase